MSHYKEESTQKEVRRLIKLTNKILDSLRDFYFLPGTRLEKDIFRDYTGNLDFFLEGSLQILGDFQEVLKLPRNTSKIDAIEAEIKDLSEVFDEFGDEIGGKLESFLTFEKNKKILEVNKFFIGVRENGTIYTFMFLPIYNLLTEIRNTIVDYQNFYKLRDSPHFHIHRNMSRVEEEDEFF